MKRVLIFHNFASKVPAGDCFQPLLLISAFQKRGDCDVTVVTNIDFDIAGAARKFGLEIDPSRLSTRQLRTDETPPAHPTLAALQNARKLKRLAENADVCISTTGVRDFGKPGHHFICNLNSFGGKAFYDHVHASEIISRTGIRRRGRKLCSWIFEHIVRPIAGLRPLKTIVTDPAERIYSASDYVANVLRAYFGDFAGHVFYPPTTFEFTLDGVLREPLRVVYVGRISPQKRVMEIVEAVRRAREISGAELELQIAGALPETPYVAALRQRAKENAWLHLLGPAYGEAKERLMLSATYAMHAERDEAFGIAVAEYLKAGIVPVVPDAGGAQEVVNNPSLSYRTVDDAARTLVRLVSDAAFRDEQRRRCAERAALFSRAAYAARQAELLEEMLSPNGADKP